MQDLVSSTTVGSPPDVYRRFDELAGRQSRREYNFEHFRMKHLLMDAKATAECRGIEPGRLAPDFELNRVGGGRLRLSDFRGRAVLLHFGSFT
jgi:hypothetical protein